MAGASTPKKRGRAATHWSEKLRTLVWYRDVVAKTQMSDYMLNKKFVNDEIGLNKQPQRVFESIRIRLTVPGRNSANDATPDLVSRLEKAAPGSQYLYELGLWHMLAEPPQTLMKAHGMVNDFLSRFQISRLSPEEAVDNLAMADNKMDSISLYNCCLDKVLHNLDHWNRLALLGLLCREADMAGNYAVTEATRSFLDTQLENLLFATLSYEDADLYYQLIIEEFLYSKRQMDASEAAYRMGLESKVQWPLLNHFRDI